MFKKNPTIKPFSPVRNSDRRKLLGQILENYGIEADSISSETKDNILPEVQTAKFIARGGEKGVIYVGGEKNTPLWIKMDDNTLIPTVYTLWKCPFLVPILYTWPPVIEKLQNGADMMTPGMIRPLPDNIEKGRIVAVGDIHRKGVALAVGTLSINIQNGSPLEGDHGKAVIIVNCFGDELPVKGKPVPPQELDCTLPLYDKESESKATIEASTEADTQSNDSNESAAIEKITEKIDQTNISTQSSVQHTAAATSKVNDGPSTADIDEGFRKALVATIHQSRTGTALSFPQPASTFISAHILANLPANLANIQLKQTSWKKAAKFLKAMEKEGLVKVKERGGDVTITSIAGLEHESVRVFTKYRTASAQKAINERNAVENQEKDGSEEPGSDAYSRTLDIKEFYQLKDQGKLIAEAVGASTSQYYGAAELRTMLLEYIAKEGLIDPSKHKNVKLNPVLAKILTSAGARVAGSQITLSTREELIDAFRQSCTKSYKVLRGNEDENSVKYAKGAPPKILIVTSMKMGHKITRILNVETYKIDPQELANELRVECAGSTTVNKSTEGDKKHEIQVQGPQMKAAMAVLERHGIKKIWMEIKDNTTSKRK
ncbi:hypothetical protein V1511DRAFT_491353 [Dipodascopsis uninucleata]